MIYIYILYYYIWINGLYWICLVSDMETHLSRSKTSHWDDPRPVASAHHGANRRGALQRHLRQPPVWGVEHLEDLVQICLEKLIALVVIFMGKKMFGANWDVCFLIVQIDRTCLDIFSRKYPCVDTQIWRPIYVIYHVCIYIYIRRQDLDWYWLVTGISNSMKMQCVWFWGARRMIRYRFKERFLCRGRSSFVFKLFRHWHCL